MPFGKIPQAWTTALSNHHVELTGDIRNEANLNMLIFELKEVISVNVQVGDISQFLMKAFHTFCAKAVRSGAQGWFYAWHDEMSGTLRCSACSVRTPGELPFKCRLALVDTPDKVAREAATSRYASEIPIVEFQNVEEFVEDEEASEFVLTVFVRALIRVAS